MSLSYDYQPKLSKLVKQQNGKYVTEEQILKAREMWLKSMLYEKHYEGITVLLGKRKVDSILTRTILRVNNKIETKYTYVVDEAYSEKGIVNPKLVFDPTKLLPI